MSKTATIHARLDPDLKADAESVLAQLGLSPADAIRMFYRQVSLHGGLPFEVRVPNASTRTAMVQARSGKGVKKVRSAAALMKLVDP